MKEDIVTGEVKLFALFQREISKVALLEREEEIELARLAKTGDHQAKKKLIEANLKFVVMVAFKFWRPGLQLLDLVSEGYLGLIIAANKYDHEKGTRFITYAKYWIRQKISRFIFGSDRHNLVSLDEPLNDAGDTTLHDILPAQQKSFDDTVYDNQVKQLLSCLDEREKKVLSLLFWHDLTAGEVAHMFGISKKRVFDLETRSLRKIRLMNRAGCFSGDGKRNEAF